MGKSVENQTKKSGRDIFRKYRFVFKISSAILRPVPKGLLRTLWPFLDVFRGKCGLFIRYLIIKKLCNNSGENIYVGHNVTILKHENLSLGENVSIHPNCYLDASGNIEIGSNVSIAHNSSIISFEHTWSDPSISIKYNQIVLKPVKIENDVWVGCGCRVLGGTTIKNRTIVAAGAVVTTDIGPNALFGGVPARFIKNLN